jgi:D-alanyl-D-alanine carboxypeptidase
LFLGLFAILLSVFVILSSDNNSNSIKTDFQSALDSILIEYKFPGITAAYISPDSKTETFSAGKADIESGIKMSPKSRMLAASIGKMFVGATVTALVHENILNLDDSLSKWIGDKIWFEQLPNHNKIKLHHLLRHISGIPNHVELENFKAEMSKKWNSPGNPFSPEDLIKFVLNQKPIFSPGKGWYYSDTGYILIGLVIEKATGNSYYSEVVNRFIDPLGLKLTSPSNKRTLNGLASGYMSIKNVFNLPPKTTIAPGIMVWDPGIEWTGGGLISNSKDLVIWAKALFEGKAMNYEYLETLLNSVSIKNDLPELRYGLGVAIHRNGKFGTTYGHSGWIPGYCSSLRYYKEHKFAIAFQTNTDIGIIENSNNIMEAIEIKLASIVYNHLNK